MIKFIISHSIKLCLIKQMPPSQQPASSELSILFMDVVGYLYNKKLFYHILLYYVWWNKYPCRGNLRLANFHGYFWTLLVIYIIKLSLLLFFLTCVGIDFKNNFYTACYKLLKSSACGLICCLVDKTEPKTLERCKWQTSLYIFAIS